LSPRRILRHPYLVSQIRSRLAPDCSAVFFVFCLRGSQASAAVARGCLACLALGSPLLTVIKCRCLLRSPYYHGRLRANGARCGRGGQQGELRSWATRRRQGSGPQAQTRCTRRRKTTRLLLCRRGGLPRMQRLRLLEPSQRKLCYLWRIAFCRVSQANAGGPLQLASPGENPQATTTAKPAPDEDQVNAPNFGCQQAATPSACLHFGLPQPF